MKRLLIALCCVAGVSSATGTQARRPTGSTTSWPSRGSTASCATSIPPTRPPPWTGTGSPSSACHACARPSMRPPSAPRSSGCSCRSAPGSRSGRRCAGARDRRARCLAGRVAHLGAAVGGGPACIGPSARTGRRGDRTVGLARRFEVSRRTRSLPRRPHRRRPRARPAGTGLPRAVETTMPAPSRCRCPDRAAGGRLAHAPDARRRSRHQPRRRRRRLERVPALLSVLAGFHARPAGGLGRAARRALACRGRGHYEGAAARGP